MAINADQNSGFNPNADQFLSLSINADPLFSLPLNVDQCQSMPDQGYSVLIGIDRHCSLHLPEQWQFYLVVTIKCFGNTVLPPLVMYWQFLLNYNVFLMSWSGIDQHWEELRGIDRHWEYFGSKPEFWLALIIIGQWATESWHLLVINDTQKTFINAQRHSMKSKRQCLLHWPNNKWQFASGETMAFIHSTMYTNLLHQLLVIVAVCIQRHSHNTALTAQRIPPLLSWFRFDLPPPSHDFWGPLWPESLSKQKNEGRAGPRPSFFLYYNDFLECLKKIFFGIFLIFFFFFFFFLFFFFFFFYSNNRRIFI